MKRYTRGAIAFGVLFTLGYLVGSMFCGFNTRLWNGDSSACLVVWFVICVFASIVVMFAEGMQDVK
jgi:hypothetical protein